MATEQVPASEFGGVGGLIQPEPHALSSAEQARLERSLNPADKDDNVESARARQSESGS